MRKRGDSSIGDHLILKLFFTVNNHMFAEHDYSTARGQKDGDQSISWSPKSMRISLSFGEGIQKKS